MSDTAMDWLKENSGSNYPAFKFLEIGATAKGRIVSAPKVVNTTDMNTGQPTRTLVIELEQDDGETKTLWVKAGSMTSSIRDAVTAAGADGLAEGGTLAVKYSGDGEQKKAGFNKPKLFESGYRPPTPVSTDVHDLLK